MLTLQTRYIEQLKADTAEAEAARQRVEEARAKRPPVDLRVSEGWEPLTTQIEKIMLSLPPVLKAGPFNIDFFRTKLRGKYKLYASAGDIGIALTSLGFVRKRDFTNRGGGRRYWLPPSSD